MRRYLITRGAKTTAGGTVVDGLRGFGINGVEIALEGHEVRCPACQTAGAIVCVGPRLKMDAHGRKVALSDDICLCKCDPAPRLITDQFDRYQTVTAADTSVLSRAAPVSPPTQASSTTPRTSPTSLSRPATPTSSEILESSCERNWRFYQKQAEDIVAPGGTLIADPRLRNRVINSAYAQLWRLDKRFQWAGLAAFASKQVGCGLLHAADAIEKIQVEYEAAQQLRRSARKGVWGLFSTEERERRAKLREYEQRQREYEQAARDNPVPDVDWRREGEPLSSVQQLYQHVYEMMAMGNTTLFLDVFPLHAFYRDRGLGRLETCLSSRQNIFEDEPQAVLWPVGQEKLRFGVDYPEILQAFKAIDEGDITKSVEQLAWHEQQNILQPTLYNDTKLVALLRSNHFSYITDIPSGAAQALELTLASQCSTFNDRRTVVFSQHPFANLADINQRMDFVLKAAAQFDDLLHGAELQLIEQAIEDIAEGRGVL
ncbi:PAAR domain-containing protein [Pseudomonas sp. EYE_354]|uniref:PAAR domain-containing protein n=1 Tax=Pseudomonas sp. EYE_354 TaxID=2853449 RepID=UPI002003D6AB|nr:PAAR domain-containing protein [Pseudomonas sp. EYE_354]MCK6187604.1 PAAR domain-containing protein [Pseudomonas sp. EYE_354]